MKNGNSAIMSLASEVSQISGVQLGEKQKDMVIQRLRRRMTLLGLSNEVEYIQYYLKNRISEFRELISLFTTHHSYFFREFKHFEILKEQVLPQLIIDARKRADKTIRIWSAACSRGQEVYSLAIFVEQYLNEKASDLNFQIYGTDIDEISVEYSKNAVYSKKEVDSIPQAYQVGNFVRGQGEYSDYVKIHSRLHKQCFFSTANLMDSKTWPKETFDIIFCRNVFIYFSQEDIEKTSQLFQKKLSKSGYLFLGLTETLNGLSVDMRSAGPSVYTLARPAAAEVKGPSAVLTIPKMNLPKRVLCVDDSPTILALLKQIFTDEQGFKVADTAVNGRDAISKLKLQKYDLITLDIHMPEMNGLEFLKSLQGTNFPPVIVISSVDRQENLLAGEMLKLGAKDYVEKPSLKDFSARRDEILLKARTLAFDKKIVRYQESVDQMFSDKNNTKEPKGTVGLVYKPADRARAQEYHRASVATGLIYKLLAAENRNQLGFELGLCDIVVVMSSYEKDDLDKIHRVSKKMFLLEDAFKPVTEVILQSFDLFPLASVHYAVCRYLREKNDKN